MPSRFALLSDIGDVGGGILSKEANGLCVRLVSRGSVDDAAVLELDLVQHDGGGEWK